ncbi:hypothetical protein J4481_01365 [Candidatus Pacearchaeota archaeon]|nr:hypothetical protein [Candidatus Pacearchaeota archaeon]
MEKSKERLLKLMDEGNPNIKNLDHYIRFLSQMEKPEDLGRAMFESGEGWGAGFGQMFGPFVLRLYELYPEIKNKVHNNLEEIGISENAIKEYFSKGYITEGSYAVGYMKSSIPREKWELFMERSDQLLLDVLKEYVFSEQDQNP